MTFCISCRLTQSACICEFQPKIDLLSKAENPFILLTHETEFHKRSNTGWLLKQLIPQQICIEKWQRRQAVHQYCSFGQDINQPHRRPILLYPAAQANHSERVFDCFQDEWEGRPFIGIDATWQLAGKMYRQSKWLHDLDVWSVALPDISLFTLRRGQKQGACSTFEVVCHILQQRGSAEVASQMMQYFELFQKQYGAS